MDLEYESPPRKKRIRDEEAEDSETRKKKAKVQDSEDDDDEDLPAKVRMARALGQVPNSMPKASTSGRSEDPGAPSGSGRGSGHTLSLAASSTLRGSGASSPLKPDAAATFKGSKKGKEKEVVPIEPDHEVEGAEPVVVDEPRRPSHKELHKAQTR